MVQKKSSEQLQLQLEANRRSVSFDSYDLSVRQLIEMVLLNNIDIAPEYQRHFKWNQERQSQLIESILLGIPVPSLFMATNKDSTWEVVDGLQRLTTIVNFMGTEAEIEKVNPLSGKLRLKGLEKLTAFNNYTFDELPTSLKLMFQTRPIRVTVLNDRSDFEIRYDLFERLNTGGVTLNAQEIRNCVFTGEFNDFIKICAGNEHFRSIIRAPETAENSAHYEELVLRFFAYYECADKFIHSVKEFLNNYMKDKTESFKNRKSLASVFHNTFEYLSDNLPDGIVRSNRKGSTPIVLFEAISVGVARIIDSDTRINSTSLIAALDDQKLKGLTTGATNSRNRVLDRINYVQELIKI